MLSAGASRSWQEFRGEGEQEEPERSQNCRSCPRERQPPETPASTDAGRLPTSGHRVGIQGGGAR